MSSDPVSIRFWNIYKYFQERLEFLGKKTFFRIPQESCSSLGCKERLPNEAISQSFPSTRYDGSGLMSHLVKCVVIFINPLLLLITSHNFAFNPTFKKYALHLIPIGNCSFLLNFLSKVLFYDENSRRKFLQSINHEQNLKFDCKRHPFRPVNICWYSPMFRINVEFFMTWPIWNLSKPNLRINFINVCVIDWYSQNSLIHWSNNCCIKFPLHQNLTFLYAC